MKHDVIVVGAGPVGSFLACELALARVSVLVLERDVDQAPWKSTVMGMRGLNTSALDALQRRGLLDAVIDTTGRTSTLAKGPEPEFVGHFAGMDIDANKVDLARWPYRLPGPSLVPTGAMMQHIEDAFADRARKLGVVIKRGAVVTAARQTAEEVTVEANGELFSASWLVGCDGGRSTIRKQMGFELVGTEAECTGYAAFCDLDAGSTLEPGFHSTANGLYMLAGPQQVYALDFDGGAFDRSQGITREHFEAVLRRVSGCRVSVKALHHALAFTDRSKQVTSYRNGRVLLAGDAAHIHSALGAQGLNTGIGDAVNLGWKLAAAIKGTAPDGLLETYMSERHPFGAEALAWTRAQVDVLRPTASGRAIYGIVHDLIATTDGASYVFDRLNGLTRRYDLGDPHSLVGGSAPDFECDDGTRLNEKLGSGSIVLVDLTSNNALADSVRGRAIYLDLRVKDTLGLRALLIRPDGIVAWLAEGAPNHAKLSAALDAMVR